MTNQSCIIFIMKAGTVLNLNMKTEVRRGVTFLRNLNSSYDNSRIKTGGLSWKRWFVMET